MAYSIYASPKSFLTLDAPTLTNISDPDTKNKGTSASPAMALASSVFPVPGGPTKRTPGEGGWGRGGRGKEGRERVGGRNMITGFHTGGFLPSSSSPPEYYSIVMLVGFDGAQIAQILDTPTFDTRQDTPTFRYWTHPPSATRHAN